jgi:hypothetical protein
MKLEFNSVDELQVFLNFAGYSQRVTGAGPALTESYDLPGAPARVDAFGNFAAPLVATGAELDAAGVTRIDGGTHVVDLEASGEMIDQPGTPAKATRKRRTKAEIDAENAAAAAERNPAVTAFILGGVNAPETATGAALDVLANIPPHPFGTPAAAAGAPAARVAQEMREPIGVAFDELDAKMFIASRLPALGVIDPIKHLGICRNFIATHTLAPYILSMQLVDGPGDATLYEDNHRTQHVAAMEFINRQKGGAALAHEVAAVE